MKNHHTGKMELAKRFGTHFTKYLLERDTVFATIWVFIFIVGLGSIPLNLYVLNPLKMGLKDFDFTDLAYSKWGIRWKRADSVSTKRLLSLILAMQTGKFFQ
ncbi:MAG: hypothetical protein IPK57_15255 [Chitinophagaceae bacterium]|nr:hypothetical protein [Chitinophagaceae bacterium]